MLNILTNIKEAVTIVSLASAILFGYLGYQQKQKADAANNNLYKKEIQWTTEKGELVTETTELRFTVDDLKRAAAKDSTQLSVTEKMLNKAANRIQELESNLNHVVSYTGLEMEAVHDSLETVATITDCKLDSIASINTDHLKVNFEVLEDNKVLANALYKAKVEVVIDRERRKETKKGNKRFFLARWVNPDWQYSSKAVCDDPKAKILSNVTINFDNRK